MKKFLKFITRFGGGIAAGAAMSKLVKKNNSGDERDAGKRGGSADSHHTIGMGKLSAAASVHAFRR